MRYFQICFFITWWLAGELRSQSLPADYNIKWTSPGQNAGSSMPCGGGSIGLNVWVEGGALFLYAAMSGSFNEENAMLKAGRLRFKFSPNPFNGEKFEQELHLQEGYVTVKGEHEGIKAEAKIWVDVFQPIAHVEIVSNKRIIITASYENWRYQDRIVKARENFGNSYKWAAPKNNIYKKDDINFSGNKIIFFHQNSPTTIFDLTVAQQGMEAVKAQLYNPLAGLISGGMLSGGNCVADGTQNSDYAGTDFSAWRLKSKTAATKHSFQLVLHNAQVSINSWTTSVDSLRGLDAGGRQAENQQWWKSFWERSFIHIGTNGIDSKDREIGRNYQLFRYMLACNSHSDWPTKFNGGLFTVDPVFTDTNFRLTPDYRNWGGGLHTMQNQRLVYFPMIKNGDWDLLQPQLAFYKRILKNAELRSQVYWNHGGACFTEQMENFGLPNYAEYGQKRPEQFDRGVEFNAWLEYEWDTVLEFCLMMLEEQQYTGKDISEAVPFIESCLRFFDEHYQYLAKKSGSKVLDQDGQLILYPGSGAETFKMAYNSTSTIAALRTITGRLLDLPAALLPDNNRAFWKGFLQRIPPLNYREMTGHTTIAPAKVWQRINNTESPQLYPVFPWGIFGVGRPGLDTALNTWNYDTSVVKFRSHVGWKQDNIWAARLGLSAEAWRLTALKLKSADRRFPAFWGPGYDWVPDHNWGGSGMIGLQEMLMQVQGRQILLFPAWPKEKDVHFKLHAPYNTTVEAAWKSGALTLLKVLPKEREKDVQIFQ